VLLAIQGIRGRRPAGHLPAPAAGPGCAGAGAMAAGSEDALAAGEEVLRGGGQRAKWPCL